MSHFIQDNQAVVKMTVKNDDKFYDMYMFLIKGGDNNVFDSNNRRLSEWNIYQILDREGMESFISQLPFWSSFYNGSWQFQSYDKVAKFRRSFLEKFAVVYSRFKKAFDNFIDTDIVIDMQEYERNVSFVKSENGSFGKLTQDSKRYLSRIDKRIAEALTHNGFKHHHSMDYIFQDFAKYVSNEVFQKILDGKTLGFKFDTSKNYSKWTTPLAEIAKKAVGAESYLDERVVKVIKDLYENNKEDKDVASFVARYFGKVIETFNKQTPEHIKEFLFEFIQSRFEIETDRYRDEVEQFLAGKMDGNIVYFVTDRFIPDVGVSYLDLRGRDRFLVEENKEFFERLGSEISDFARSLIEMSYSEDRRSEYLKMYDKKASANWEIAKMLGLHDLKEIENPYEQAYEAAKAFHNSIFLYQNGVNFLQGNIYRLAKSLNIIAGENEAIDHEKLEMLQGRYNLDKIVTNEFVPTSKKLQNPKVMDGYILFFNNNLAPCAKDLVAKLYPKLSEKMTELERGYNENMEKVIAKVYNDFQKKQPNKKKKRRRAAALL